MKVSDLYLRDFTNDMNMVLIFKRGFKRFNKALVSKNGIRWKCVRKRQGCRSFLITDHKAEEILEQGYMRHTCRKTKREKQLSRASKQSIRAFFGDLGFPMKKGKQSKIEKEFGHISHVLSSLKSVLQKKVSFIEPSPPMKTKAPEDPKEYITQYFKRDTQK